jgi:aminoglycoside 3-N-acetyltransferase
MRLHKDPVTIKSLVTDLVQLGVQPGMVLVVHSALSQLGWVCGGAPSVVLALEQALTHSGTLIMPTHTSDLSEPSYWINPPVPEAWWPVIRGNLPAYDPDLTPTRVMGAMPECFRKQKNVQRSNHPQVSFAAWGKNAASIVAEHPLDFGLGDGTPLARAYGLGAMILLLGVGHSCNTSLHLAEYRADYPGRKVVREGAPILYDGKRVWVEFNELDYDSKDFEAIGADYEREKQDFLQGYVGYARAILVSQVLLVDYAVKWLETNR